MSTPFSFDSLGVVIIISLPIIAIEYLLFELYRQYIFIFTAIFMLSLFGFLPFLFIPSIQNISIIIEFCISLLAIIWLSMIHISYYPSSHHKIQQHRNWKMNKILFKCSTYLLSSFNNSSKDLRQKTNQNPLERITNENRKNAIQTFYHSKCSSYLMYILIFIHISYIAIQDVLINESYFNMVATVILLLSIPIPNQLAYNSVIFYVNTRDGNRGANGNDRRTNDIQMKCTFFLIFIYSSCYLCFAFAYALITDRNQFFTLHVIQMAVSLIRSLLYFRRDLFFISRVFCISIFLLITNAPFYNVWGGYFLYIRNFPNGDGYKMIVDVWGVCNIFLCISYVLFYMRWIYKQWSNDINRLKVGITEIVREQSRTVTATKDLSFKHDSDIKIARFGRNFNAAKNYGDSFTAGTSLQSPSSAYSESQITDISTVIPKKKKAHMSLSGPVERHLSYEDTEREDVAYFVD